MGKTEKDRYGEKMRNQKKDLESNSSGRRHTKKTCGSGINKKIKIKTKLRKKEGNQIWEER